MSQVRSLLGEFSLNAASKTLVVKLATDHEEVHEHNAEESENELY